VAHTNHRTCSNQLGSMSHEEYSTQERITNQNESYKHPRFMSHTHVFNQEPSTNQAETSTQLGLMSHATCFNPVGPTNQRTCLLSAPL